MRRWVPVSRNRSAGQKIAPRRNMRRNESAPGDSVSYDLRRGAMHTRPPACICRPLDKDSGIELNRTAL